MILTNILEISLLSSLIGISLAGVPAQFEEKYKVETVRPGDNIVLRCDVTGDQPISIVWFKDKIELEITESSRHEKFEIFQRNGVNSGIFIQNFDYHDGALYSCNATNGYGSDERNIKVIVVEVPGKPLNVHVLDVWERSAKISWTSPYGGNSPITKYKVQYWNDKSGSQRFHEEEISGTQTTTVIQGLKPGISYALAVVAENKIGHGEPSETIRFIASEEEPYGPPLDVYAEASGPTSILVKWKPPIKDSSPGEVIGYYVGYKREESKNPYTFKSIEASSNGRNEYLITGLTKSARYIILIKAYNKAGAGPPSQDLFISTSDEADALKWLEQPNDVITVIGTTINVRCNASGSSEPRIYWIKYSGSNVVPLIHSDSLYSNINDTYLVIPQISHEDAGTYACIADNGIQPRIKANFSITVRVPARIEEEFALVYAKKGDIARLKCEVRGDQQLSVTWQKDKTTINKSGDERYDILETMTLKGMISELIIKSTNWGDGTFYTCIAENDLGNAQRKIRFIVMEVPAPPTNVKIQKIWSRSASVSWEPLKSGNSSITNYIVQQARSRKGHSYHPREISVTSSQSTALVKELHPDTAYILKVFAENVMGRSEPSDHVFFRTDEEVPDLSPVDIKAEAREPSTILVSWRKPPKSHWHGEPKGFYIGYKSEQSHRPYSYKSVKYLSEDLQEFLLTNLLNSTDYCIVVQAFNSAGRGPPSGMCVKTLNGDLFPGPSLYVLNTSRTSISLRLDTRNIDKSLLTYIVHYREDNGEWEEVAVIGPEGGTYTLSNLKSQKLYQIYVTVTNEYGESDPSETVVVKTN